VDFRRSLSISAGLHVAIIAAGLITFSITPHRTTPSIDHIPIEFAESSEDPQSAGERDAQRQETPQRREVANPSRDPDPVPPVERAPPVEASSAPVPPPPPERAAQPEPRPAPAPVPPPPPERQVAQAEEPPDTEGLQRQIEQQRREEQRRQQEQQRQERQRQDAERRREEQRRQAEQRRQQQEERRRQEQARREEQRRQEAQRQEFDPQRVRDIINRQQGAPQQQGVRGDQTRTASLGNPASAGRRLTQSDYARLIGLIRDQIAPCYSPPPGAGAAPPVIRVELFMNRDGSLNGRPRVMNAGAARPYADSAVRAIMNCAQRQGGRLNLPADMYDAQNGWKEIEFAFDPSQML
jgi:hypothetical protein